ncbi:MAG TPA: hypothetical protein VKD89_08035 [Candidatus Udaeobacter sp.]|nr:hypothetical protein [Candidatus Udaeobacter sp.]
MANKKKLTKTPDHRQKQAKAHVKKLQTAHKKLKLAHQKLSLELKKVEKGLASPMLIWHRN